MSKNKIQLSDFSYVKRAKISLGKALRFTLSLSFDVGDLEPVELALEGCLAYYKSGIGSENSIYWQPPITRVTGNKTRQTHWMNAKLFDLVRDKIIESGLMAECLKPIEELRKTEPERPFTEVYYDLPKVLEI